MSEFLSPAKFLIEQNIMNNDDRGLSWGGIMPMFYEDIVQHYLYRSGERTF